MIAPRLLRTRVARRILALFLLCAVLPVVTFAVLGYRVVANRLEVDALEQLRQGSKTAGLVLFDRLQMLSSELAQIGGTRNTESGGGFESVFLDGGEGGFTTIQGRPGPVPRLTTRQEAHLAAGSPVLITVSDSGSAKLFLVMTTPVQGGKPLRLWGIAPPAVLLGQQEGMSPAPPGTELCVVDAKGLPISCHNPKAASALRALATDPERHADWERGDSLFLMGRWNLFLGNGFSSPAWTIALSLPAAVAFAPLRAFRRVSVLAVALAGLLVFFLSHVQLRKRMTPLAELESGVRRISAGDFSVPVAIQSKDEFEMLADSFNGMARDLQRQFSTLNALHVVDLAALEVHSAEAIAEAALTWAPDLLDSEVASVAFADLQDPSRWIAMAQPRGGGQQTRTVIRPGPEELRELADHPQYLRIEAGDRGRSYVALAGLNGEGERLVFPIRHAEKPRAVLVVGRRDSTPYSAGAIALGRQLADQLAVGLSNVLLLSELSALSEGSMLALARTIDANSPWTAGHSERVTQGALEIGRRRGLDAASLDRLRRGGLLHDIGKIGIPTTILDKAGPLTEAERTVIQSHPTIGAEIVRPIAAFQDIIPLIQSHHELLDGSGYPEGLTGGAIPEVVRILTVADIFDALSSDRPYRPGLSHQEALTLLRDGAGRRFDAEAVETLAFAITEGWSSAVPEHRAVPQQGNPLHLELVP
jgi:putative nucleotidyltransferase with HDIG domain